MILLLVSTRATSNYSNVLRVLQVQTMNRRSALNSKVIAMNSSLINGSDEEFNAIVVVK